MKAEAENIGFGREQIHTLAESGTQKSLNSSPMAIVSGKGTDISKNPSLANRAKRKVISRKMILALIDVAKEKGEPEREKAYWNTYHCQSTVIVSGNKLYTKYCKNRFCTVCCAIREADFTNRYLPKISTWYDMHFVTLTAKSVKADYLNKRIWRMLRAFELILNRCKKRHQRGKGVKSMGIKSLECNFNPIKKTYNPHYHIIVPSKEVAELLKKEWIKQYEPIRGIHGLANFLGVSPVTAQKLKNSGTIPYTQFDRIVQFEPQKVLDALEANNKPKK